MLHAVAHYLRCVTSLIEDKIGVIVINGRAAVGLFPVTDSYYGDEKRASWFFSLIHAEKPIDKIQKHAIIFLK
jgi:hypothetical protein